MENLKDFLNKHYWILVIVLSLPAWWALLVPGFYGASDDIHIAWLHQMHQTLMVGQIPPRFVPDLSFGFGYPLFNFVFPLPFYIGEIFHLLGLSFVDSVKTLFLLSVPLSAFAMYLLLREFCNKGLSLAGAILYIYTPYRAVDLYVRGAIGEIVSFIFLPLIVLSMFKLFVSLDKRWIGIGALSLASLVLSHNITAFMFLPFLLLLLALLYFSASKKRLFLKASVLMISLALSVSSYFWLPAIVDSKLMKYDTIFNFADHYPTLLQLITPYWGYGASVPGPYDGMSFFLGHVNLVLPILGIALTFIFWSKLEKNKKILLSWAFISTLAAIFMMDYRSQFIWNNIPYLPYFQFPWRYLMVTTFAIPIFIITLDNFKNIFIPLAIIILILITSASYFRPQDFLGRQDDYFINRYIPTPFASNEYLKTQEEYLRLPKNTQKRPDRNYPLVSADLIGDIKRIKRINDLDVLIDVESKNGTTINYNKYLFPGWEAKIDGRQVDITPGKPFGQINVNVPPGEHKVEITFKETDFKKMLDAISLLSFLVSLSMLKVSNKIYGTS